MTENRVIGLDGKPIEQKEGEPSPEIINAIEDLLRDAKAGLINGFGYVYYKDDKEELTSYYTGNAWRLMAGFSRLNHRMNLATDDIQENESVGPDNTTA